MALFDEVNQRFGQDLGRTTGGLSGLLNGIASVSPAGAGMAVARQALGKYAPGAYGPVSKALKGDFFGAGIDALRQTKLGAKVNDILTKGSLAHILNQSFGNPLLGGLTLLEAEQMLDQIQSTAYARKNLFYLEITDYLVGTPFIAPASSLFNLFATAISFSPVTISGDATQIGSASMDRVHGRELVQMRITTLDNVAGDIKTWFKTRADGAVRRDGTFGVPADYLVKVRLIQAAINDDVRAKFGGHDDSYVMRCASIENEMQRGEQGLQELQLSFTQFDSFAFQE